MGNLFCMRTMSSKFWIKCFTKQFGTLMTLRNKPFENIEGKGEIADNQQIVYFQQYFLLYQILVIEPHLFCHLQISKFPFYLSMYYFFDSLK